MPVTIASSIQGKVVAANVTADINDSSVASYGTIDVKMPDSIFGGNCVLTLEVAAGTLIASLNVGASCSISITQP